MLRNVWRHGSAGPKVKTLILNLKKCAFFPSFFKPDIHFNVNNLKPFKTWCEDLMLSSIIAETFIENVWS